jgi:DNA processing protein
VDHNNDNPGGARHVPRHIRRGDSHWPVEFERVEAPPEEIWTVGRSEWLVRRPAVAIVGTRAPTEYGVQQARRFASALAGAGVTIVSGLARGIDAEAHTAALERGGATVAVVGSGVDRPWPDGRLTERMIAEALLVSELAPGTPPRRHHFPLRNRLIAALASIVVVIEAAEKSGSLITARWAVDLGREVFALPGRVDHPMARGCLRLITQGARLALSPADVLAELGASAENDVEGPLPPNELVDALARGVASAHELAQRTGFSLGAVLSELAELELDGRVARVPGGLYRRLA